MVSLVLGQARVRGVTCPEKTPSAFAQKAIGSDFRSKKGVSDL